MEVEKAKKFCKSCPNFEADAKKINDCIALGLIHGAECDVPPIIFCPWCGGRLLNVKEEKQ